MKIQFAIVLCSLLTACTSPRSVDILITNGTVYDGTDSPARALDIGICGATICSVSPKGELNYVAKKTIDADGMIVSPGFIDPHTHSFSELQSEDKNDNSNYLFQGVTTVVNGNDGGGPADIGAALKTVNANGVGTNFALFAGHGTIRREVVGIAYRPATGAEVEQMKTLLDKAMTQGALGLSTGLYYVPGQFADTAEVIELAKIAAMHNGIYETHLRDESSFNIGFSAAVSEAIEIAENAGLPLHLAHIKALGVDVWGESKSVIKQIESAKSRGVTITADQYPWLASGTNIRSAIIPKWAMADSEEAFFGRIDDPEQVKKIRLETALNIRRRGGPEKLLITASPQADWVGKTLKELANEWDMTAVNTALKMVKMGRHRVASYNMNPEDVELFMVQPWVVTSSDGTNGHPRKYASFPKKYREFVVEKGLITEQRFIHSSTGQTASILGLTDRGYVREGNAADIIVFDPDTYRDKADFSNWNRLSTGVNTVVVNGSVVIDDGAYTGVLTGKFLARQR